MRSNNQILSIYTYNIHIIRPKTSMYESILKLLLENNYYQRAQTNVNKIKKKNLLDSLIV